MLVHLRDNRDPLSTHHTPNSITAQPPSPIKSTHMHIHKKPFTTIKMAPKRKQQQHQTASLGALVSSLRSTGDFAATPPPRSPLAPPRRGVLPLLDPPASRAAKARGYSPAIWRRCGESSSRPTGHARGDFGDGEDGEGVGVGGGEGVGLEGWEGRGGVNGGVFGVGCRWGRG